MAKKTVTTTQSGKSRDFVQCIKMQKSERKGSYVFKEGFVHSDKVKAFFAKEN